MTVTYVARGTPLNDGIPVSEHYIGLMSGTSMDGVDGVVATFLDGRPTVRAHASRPFPDELKAIFMALNTPGDNEIHRAALAGNALVQIYASVVDDLLATSGLDRSAIVAIGAHGQTVRHQPGTVDGVGYTTQINAPALLAERCGIDVVADFRSRDLAAGGQGAPLASGFHRAVFERTGNSVLVLNIGGIANLTILPADGQAQTGFDCGPGNCLMDHWCQKYTGAAFDDAGRWAAQGTVRPEWLKQWLADPYFALAPPKSTGRDLFNPRWLEASLAGLQAGRDFEPVDVQASLAELTARSIAQAVQRHAAACCEVIVCGGGACNDHLMARLASLLPTTRVVASHVHGVPAMQVEAAAFAWLARCTVRREPGNLPGVTGAAGPRVLGAVYPA